MFRSKIKIINKKNLAIMTPVTILGLLGGIKGIRFGGGRLSIWKWRTNPENALESRMKYS